MKRFIFMAILLVFGLALFSGCAAIKGETTGEYIDDSTITTKVNAAIVEDPDTHYFKIDVTTLQGAVVLQGFVNSKVTEDRLVAKIRNMRGVKSVKSLLKIEMKK